MSDYRIEYLSDGQHPDERLSLHVPDLTTALVVAEINRPDGDVELWQGTRQLGHLHRDADSTFWKVL